MGKGGIWIGPGGTLRLKVSGKFTVFKDAQRQEVLLVNHNWQFLLASDGRDAYIRLWDTWYLLHPMLNLPDVKRAIGLRPN